MVFDAEENEEDIDDDELLDTSDEDDIDDDDLIG